MRFTLKHKAVIIIILLIIVGYFYFQDGGDANTVEVVPPQAVEDAGEAEEAPPVAVIPAEPVIVIAGEGNETPQEAVEEQPKPLGQIFEVEMSDHLEPAELTIPLGATVVWKNMAKRPHLIHIYTLNGGYKTVTVGEKIGLVGDTWEYTFIATGVYNYRDTIFNWRGIITVE